MMNSGFTVVCGQEVATTEQEIHCHSGSTKVKFLKSSLICRILTNTILKCVYATIRFAARLH